MDTTDIEKKSLEAHVELCAERYKLLETKIESIDEKIDTLFSVIAELRGIVQSSATKNNDRLISWGLGVIGFLVATVGWLVSHYVLIK
jgi:hypothetical protein